MISQEILFDFYQNHSLPISCNHFYVQNQVSLPAEAKFHFVYCSTGLLSILYQKWGKMRGRTFLFIPSDKHKVLLGCEDVFEELL